MNEWSFMDGQSWQDCRIVYYDISCNEPYNDVFISLHQETDMRARQRRKALVKKIQELMEQCDRVQENVNQLMTNYT